MKQQELVNQARDLLAEISTKVSFATKNNLLDINQVAEGLVLRLIRIAWNHSTMRSLNAEEKKNYPGIDLADDSQRVAVQVTATPTMAKIKTTIKTFLKHNLDRRYDRLVFVLITQKQSRYSSKGLNEICSGRLKFDIGRDVLDFGDLLGSAINLEPNNLSAFTQCLRDYSTGATSDTDESNFDPPRGAEPITAGLLEIFLPQTLFVADAHLPSPTDNRRQWAQSRKQLREAAAATEQRLPSGYEVHANQVLTFHDLQASNNPFRSVIDAGTVTPLKPREFYLVDSDQEARFKSLLRLSLQEKLYRERIQWMFKDNLFAFIPRYDEDLLREETWQGEKRNERIVYERKLSKKSADKIYTCKHFAFTTEFIRIEDRWFVALTPEWYFSFPPEYRRSAFADEQVSWLKRREVNLTVRNHFEFLTWYLKNLDTADLFDRPESSGHSLSFGEPVVLPTQVMLEDARWLPIRDVEAEDPESFQQARLFDT
ncbi:MAG: SMEK domain-containing protein [Steroidobacteraceae bacterium]